MLTGEPVDGVVKYPSSSGVDLGTIFRIPRSKMNWMSYLIFLSHSMIAALMTSLLFWLSTTFILTRSWWQGRFLCSQGRGGDNFVSDCKLLLSGDGEHQDCLSSVSCLTQRRHMSRIVSLILTPGPGSAGEWELQAGITIRWDISFISNQFCNNFPWVDVPCTMCTNSSFSKVYTLYAYSHKPCLLWSFVVFVIKCKHTSYAGQKSLIRKRTKWFSIWTHQLQSMISQDLSTIMTQFLRRMKARLPRFQMMCDLYGVV